LPVVERLRLEYRVRQEKGGTRWIREQLRVLRGGPEGPPEIVGLMTDVTFERSVGGQVARLEDELWRSRKLESVGSMAGSVAHDFNNLLTVILATTDLLRKNDELPGEARQDVRSIRDAATRGTRLVRQLLSFSARTPGSGSDADFKETLEDMEELLGRTVGERVSLELDAGSELWRVPTDRAHVEQIVFNLAINAAEAMPGGGSLRVEARNESVEEEEELDRGRLVPGRYVRLTVRDTGHGMPPGIRERVLEPFFSTKERPEEGGRRAGGFGLATVVRVVRGYGGAVRIESDPGAGSAFHVYFPVREPMELEAREARALGTIEEPRRGGARVLIVEDDPSVRSVAERVLVREGHSVVAVASAGEGLQVFDRVRPPFDLLITDVVLPDRSGPTLFRALLRRVPDLPVIFMSGYGREQAAREGMDESLGTFLTKPFTPGELSRAVEDLLERRTEREAEPLPRAEEGGAGG
ncbi:MAG TPA: response regulator, partial [Longimicrobiales bacterium]|nr:response regulator [Longimicrobiales bacterium]